MRNELTPPELQLSGVEESLVQRLRVRERALSTPGDSYLRSLTFAGSILMFEQIGVQWLVDSRIWRMKLTLVTYEQSVSE